MKSDTRETIMEAGRKTVQAHGYNGLGFRELAKEVGIKSASIHYHFPTKGDLLNQLYIETKTEMGAAALDVTRQTVSNWRARHDTFPEPVAELRSGPIWTRSAIRRWYGARANGSASMPFSKPPKIRGTAIISG